VNPYQQLEQRAKDATSIEDAAAVLEILLSEGLAVWEDGSLYSIKQLVARVDGLQIHVYPREHAPPHFHVVAGDIDAAFALHDCTLIRGEIDGRRKRLVEWWYQRCRSTVIEAWNASRPDDCPVGPFVDESRSNTSLERTRGR
jgi:hypothetical protein